MAPNPDTIGPYPTYDKARQWIRDREARGMATCTHLLSLNERYVRVLKLTSDNIDTWAKLCGFDDLADLEKVTGTTRSTLLDRLVPTTGDPMTIEELGVVTPITVTVVSILHNRLYLLTTRAYINMSNRVIYADQVVFS